MGISLNCSRRKRCISTSPSKIFTASYEECTHRAIHRDFHPYLSFKNRAERNVLSKPELVGKTGQGQQMGQSHTRFGTFSKPRSCRSRSASARSFPSIPRYLRSSLIAKDVAPTSARVQCRSVPDRPPAPPSPPPPSSASVRTPVNPCKTHLLFLKLTV